MKISRRGFFRRMFALAGSVSLAKLAQRTEASGDPFVIDKLSTLPGGVKILDEPQWDTAANGSPLIKLTGAGHSTRPFDPSWGIVRGWTKWLATALDERLCLIETEKDYQIKWGTSRHYDRRRKEWLWWYEEILYKKDRPPARTLNWKVADDAVFNECLAVLGACARDPSEFISDLGYIELSL